MKHLRILAPLLAMWLGADCALALELTPADIRGQSSKEPVSVLQNRYFLKAYRPELGLTAGALIGDAYTNTVTWGARAGLYFNEWLGVQIEQAQTKVSDSADRKALNDLHYYPINGGATTTTTVNGKTTTSSTVVTPDPQVNRIHGMTDLAVEAAPLYGKLNLLDLAIVYTDLYLDAGLSRVETDQGTKAAKLIGAGERFYIGKDWSIRLNFRDRIFTEERAGQNSTRNSKAFDFGASYFFN